MGNITTKSRLQKELLELTISLSLATGCAKTIKMIAIFDSSSESSPIRWNWITLAGPDAKDFLHRLTTANLKSLQVGQGNPACFLTAQGKIRAYFTLWNYRPQEYAFEFDGGSSGKWKSDLLALVDQLTFSEKFEVADVTPRLESRWLFFDADDMQNAPIGTIQAGETIGIDEEIRVCHHGNGDYGKTWISVWGRPGRLTQWIEHSFPGAQTIDFQTLEAWRIQSLSPQVGREITEEVLPLEIGLRNAIAENKGCYPGQEVIEKILALGSPPKRLVQIQGEGIPPNPGEKILNLAEQPTEVGQVTSVTKSNQGFSVLGIVRKIHAKEGLKVKFLETSTSTGVVIKVAHYE